MLSDMLKRLAVKASAVDRAKILSRKHYLQEDLQERYTGRLDKAIIENTTLKKGVYKTKEEFLSNSPSITDYDFKAEMVYVKADNSSWLSFQFLKLLLFHS